MINKYNNECEITSQWINKEMMEVKAGEFNNWYNNLPGYLQSAYTREFDRLQTKYDNL